MKSSILAVIIAAVSFNAVAADQWSAIYGDVNNAFHDNGVNVVRAQEILSRRAGLSLTADQVKDMATHFSNSSITQYDTLQDIAKRYPSHVEEPVIIVSSRTPVVAAQQVVAPKVEKITIRNDTPEAKPQTFAVSNSSNTVLVNSDIKANQPGEVETVSKTGTDTEISTNKANVFAVSASNPGEVVKGEVKAAEAAEVKTSGKSLTDSEMPTAKKSAPVAQANIVSKKPEVKLIVEEPTPIQKQEVKPEVKQVAPVSAPTVVYAPVVSQDQIDANNRAIADTNARSKSNSQRIDQMEKANNKRFTNIEDQQSNDRKEYRAGIAGAASIAGLHYVDKDNAVAMGAANFKDQQGYAIGYRHKFSDNAAATIAASGTSNGDSVVAGSVSFGW